MRVLALISDAFGGHGGIAQYNRDLLTAFCSHPRCREVVAIPRYVPKDIERLPGRLTYRTDGVGHKYRYFRTVVGALRDTDYDIIVCGHINLMPLAALAGLRIKKPVLLLIYGVEAWRPTKSRLANHLVRNITSFLSISDFTKQKFLSWAQLDNLQGFLLPNAIGMDRYAPKPKDQALLAKYQLKAKTVLMTLGRMVASEPGKGFDEVLELLPDLSRDIPNICYLVVGDGDDRNRLEQKAKALGVSRRVVFAGSVPENEKAAHYCLADAFVMPGKQEGFGFVYLEAMACGVPVVASKIDGSREAVLDGSVGILVDPRNRDEIKNGVFKALKRPKVVPAGLEFFSFPNFEKRLHAVIDQTLKESRC